jgi:hypothetical protein
MIVEGIGEKEEEVRRIVKKEERIRIENSIRSY